MREAIEAVIKDLETRFELCMSGGMYNRAAAFELSIDKLKGVLSQHADNPSERIPADTERTE